MTVSTTQQSEAPVKNKSIQVYEGTPFSRDVRTNGFYKNGKALDLTPTEVNILKFFLEHPDTPLTREEILQGVWGDDFYGDPDIVNVNIRRLRVKIEESAKSPKFIKTEWNYGYRWNNGDDE
jgi:DNA-binding response OmpR family regulator